jgi:predicted 3-demethylubiquinone-9 3-methyltransferase (glyoxalase superfamily)
MTPIVPCLWFADEAEEAARYYCAIFPRSRITAVSRYGEAGREIHRRPPGSVLTVAFELDRQPFTALNAGPRFKFNEAVSLQVMCETQAEIDHFWERLGAGGDPAARQCGWLKDRYGLSWQVVPKMLAPLLLDPSRPGSQAAFAAVMDMEKLDIAALERAAASKA